MSDIIDPMLSRRNLLLGAATVATSASITGCANMASAFEGSNDPYHVPTRDKSELEINNENLVTKFCIDWNKMDAEYLAEFLDEKVAYMMFEGRPDIVGKGEFIKLMKPFFKSLKGVEWKMLSSQVIGDIVINERIDHFYAKNPKRSMHFGIAGFFLVRDNKIKIWRDYNMPGGIRKLGPLVSADELD